MWGVVREDVRGEAIRLDDVAVTPVARTFGMRMGPVGARWGWMVSYSAPAIEVVHRDDEPDLVMLPDIGLWTRLAGAVLLTFAVVTLGGRR